MMLGQNGLVQKRKKKRRFYSGFCLIVAVIGYFHEISWPYFAQVLHLVRQCYHGGQFDGRQCQKFLTDAGLYKLEKILEGHLKLETNERLTRSVLRKCQKLSALSVLAQPYLKLFRSVGAMERACFGIQLRPDYKQRVAAFESQYLSMPELPLTSKIHMIITHLRPFCEAMGCGLGIYSEQAAESLHFDYDRNLEFCTVNDITDPAWGVKQKQFLVRYNAKNL